MKQIKQLIYIEAQTMVKVVVALFFTIIFPLVFMVIMMMTTGNPQITDTYYFINKYVIISYIIALVPVTFISFPISLAVDFEYGIFERYKLFKVSIVKVFIAKILTVYMYICIQLITVTLFALFYKLILPPVNVVILFMFIYFLIATAMLCVGWTIAFSFKRIVKVQIIGMTLMFIFFIFSGVFGDLSGLPAIVDKLMFFAFSADISNDLGSLWIYNEFNVSGLVYKYLVIDVILICISIAVLKKANCKAEFCESGNN